MKNQRIGPYVLGKTLGAGTTGLVKLAVHAETNQKVAIKIVKKDTSTHMDSDNSFNMKLEREITIMKLIQHPHIMQLYDVYETPTELFLVLEHIEGGELFDHLVKKGRLSEPEALQFFQQIIFGMEFVHRHMIIHRDLKPENLLLDKNMNIKIADFGMARMQLQGKMLDTSCGSPHYASPEVIRGIPYDGPATDIWSCGVILYALMAGHLPFDDENTVRLLAKIKAGFFVMPQHISPLAKDLVSKMLVIDPKRRITMDKIMSHPWFTSQRPVYDYPLATDHVYVSFSQSRLSK
ncbi:kinase-like domain-containing protein [Cladochytrium replicatum]|nr:kinase-like domain-containing protein [Cladochytrium replicatum]